MSLCDTDYRGLQSMLVTESGILLEAGKTYLVESRLTPVAREEGFTTVEALVRRAVVAPGAVRKKVVDALTTNETSFFRDRTPFEVLRTHLLPELVQRRASARRLRIWSAACSTGQEAVSIAITILEAFPELTTWGVRIEGSDLNTSIVAKAKAGRYGAVEVNRGLPAPFLLKYFRRAGLDWEVAPAVRALCDFRPASLLDPAPGPYDLVFLRNVLIYFPNEVRVQVYRRIRAAMAPDATLILGSTETPPVAPDGFERQLISGLYVLRPTPTR